MVGKVVLEGYRLLSRLRNKAFSIGVGGAFAAFGTRSVLELPIRISGAARIGIGSDVFVGSGSWLQVIDVDGRSGEALRIGDGTTIAGGCVLSAVEGVTLGKRVLFARNVYVSDHSHGFDRIGTAVRDQPVTRISPVEIGDGAWLGQNVVVGPGVRIGRGAVIGANAVVLDDVPDHAVAVGAPARIVRVLGDTSPTAAA
jgi:acetyltransferase-like isoleucine patch superfamily enzyme